MKKLILNLMNVKVQFFKVVSRKSLHDNVWVFVPLLCLFKHIQAVVWCSILNSFSKCSDNIKIWKRPAYPSYRRISEKLKPNPT